MIKFGAVQAIVNIYLRSPRLQSLYRRRLARFFSPWIVEPPYSKQIQKMIARSGDPVRYAAVALALERVKRENIPGAIAEVGVYRGDLSMFINAVIDRRLYLFDTFSGLPEPNEHIQRFTDTSLEAVKKRVNGNAVFRVGLFPDTAVGLTSERFSFVSLDADLYNPTLAGLKFFWPRISPGGYIFAHDYYSGWPVAQAVRDSGISEFIELPDKSGSIVFRKPL
jgi:O-methyltransferase